MSALKQLLTRLREPSTYAGLAGVLAMVGVSLAPADMQSYVYLAAGLSGVIAMFLPDDKSAA